MLTAEIPTIETERLVLRGWEQKDLDPFARMMADPEVARFIGGAQPRNNVWRSMATFIGHWMLRGYGFWVVERKTDRAFLGRVGLWQPEGWPGLEVGWALDRPYWGSGYATEASAAVVDYGFRAQPIPRLISLIESGNQRSQRVAERLRATRGLPITLEIFGTTFSPEVWTIERGRWKTARDGTAHSQNAQ